MLIEEPDRPRRQPPVRVYLRRSDDRLVAFALKVMECGFFWFDKAVPDRDSHTIHEVIAMSLSNYLDARLRRTGCQLGQFGLASGMQVSFWVFDQA